MKSSGKNKASKEKTAIKQDHDPLAWLTQDIDGEDKAEESINAKFKNIQNEKNTENYINSSAVLAEEEIQKKEKQSADISETNEYSGEKEEAIMADTSIDEVTEDKGSEHLVLGDDISIIHVAELKQDWLALIDSNKNITIDAQQVEDIDTAGLQLLLSFVKTVRSSGRQVHWSMPSETLIRAVTETALKDVMGCSC